MKENSNKEKQQLQFNPEQINALSTQWNEKFKAYQELTEYSIMIDSIIKENTYYQERNKIIKKNIETLKNNHQSSESKCSELEFEIPNLNENINS